MLALLLALTPFDYAMLAKTVKVEAAVNTFDEYCVVASVLNRVEHSKFPNTVSGVVLAPGQFEGNVWGASADPAIVARLRSPEGQIKILKALDILDGRTDFKGQSMLRYRVPGEDPMCHPKGNFYHYYWQS